MAEVQLSVLKRIYLQIIDGTHSDLEIVLQDGCMPGSKLCLIALSSYFEVMLSSDMLEKNTGVVTLPSITSSTFHDILKCYFLDENVINKLNCFPLLKAAEMMMLDHLKSLCLDYLSNNLTLTTDNCVDRWRILKMFSYEDLARRAFQFMVKHMDSLSESGSILNLTKSECIELLSQDGVPLKEDDVLRDVQAWINTNNPSVETMVDLFKVIRFEHVSLTYLRDEVICTSMVKDNEILQNIVQEGLRKCSEKHREFDTFCDKRLNIKNVMFVLNASTNLLSAACLTDNTWYELPPAPYNPGNWFAGAVLGDNIYITGGDYKNTSTLIYDVYRKQWATGPDLNHRHYCHCMASNAGKLYVIGGAYSNSIEQLQPEESDWQVVADLECKRYGACAEAVGEYILVIGRNVNGSPLNNFHCFNTTTHAVSTINMNMRSGLGARSYLELPNMYLVHDDGDVDVVHVAESNNSTLASVRVAKHDGYGYYFGFIHKDDNIIVVSKNGIQKVNVKDGSKESIAFQNTPTLGTIIGSLNMKVPRSCLL